MWLNYNCSEINIPTHKSSFIRGGVYGQLPPPPVRMGGKITFDVGIRKQGIDDACHSTNFQIQPLRR